ncbi:MAG TPA: TerB family tellurite resistance protein [Acetobacteraceae bacterium]|jgi:DnaJ like chaperone protein|nr:TerB family tellurite resistance protein [Acetobacteraceae bacterium]
MGYWGKIIGGMAGLAVAGPFGLFVGAALGHAADAGVLGDLRRQMGGSLGRDSSPIGPARIAALFGRREEVFAIAVTVLAAKLAKCDGTVNRAEIEAFKRHFRIPPEAVGHVGRLFDQARSTAAGYEPFAEQLAQTFADNRGTLEEVLTALFVIARADGPANAREEAYLARVHRAFGLDPAAWDRARGAAPRHGTETGDPYAVLGLKATATDVEIRATWRKLMRENHPDSLAARGVPEAFIAKASEKVARINAAWDRIKRDRGL